MKIIILTDKAERHYYFANRILEVPEWDAKVIFNGKTINISRKEKIRKILKRKPLKWAHNKVLDIVFAFSGRRLAQEKSSLEAIFFAGQKVEFEERFSDRVLARVGEIDRSLNDKRFVEMIRAEKPDAIAVMGTCLVSRAIIESAPIVINLHTGLSPYYRGGQTNFWPFLHGDLHCFGVTIHKMSTGIDSGDIIHSAQILPEADENYSSINCRAIIKGTELMIDALKLSKSGALRALPQWEKGMVFHSNDFNAYQASRYFKILENGDVQNAATKTPLKVVVNGKADNV